MNKTAHFKGWMIPGLLLLPQLLITIVFFYWPASQAVWQSFLLQDAFGTSTDFVWFENYRDLFTRPDYYKAFVNTMVFSGLVAFLSLSIALLLAAMADRQIKGAQVYTTLLIWPYAVAPAVAGVLWLFLFDPSLGMIGRGLNAMGYRWDPKLNGNQAMSLVVMAAVWKQISYNFLFFLAGLQSIPKSVIEAATIDGARPGGASGRSSSRSCPHDLLPAGRQHRLRVLRHVRHHRHDDGGGPSKATETLVYKIYSDGKGGADLGGSAAQSVILLIIVIALTACNSAMSSGR